MTSLPADISYGRVRGRVIQAVVDGPDAGDEPDAVPATGVVVFTPDVNHFVDDSSKTLVVPKPVRVNLDAYGEFNVLLIATNDPDMNPTGFTYTLSFQLIDASIPGFSIEVPSGSDQDLTEFIPVGKTSGVATLRGPSGDSAYDIAVENGFVGTEAEWLASLVGDANTYTDGQLAAEVDRADGAYAAKAVQQTVETGRLSEGALSATFAPQPGEGVQGKDVQFGKVRTSGSGPAGTSLLSFQNNDPFAGDSGTRIYLVPRYGAKVTSGFAAGFKIFGDDYTFDSTNYRDTGLYFHANQNGDTGHKGQGVFWVNSKVAGTYDGLNHDIGFSFQDGETVAGRFSRLGAGQGVLVVGSGKPDIAAKVPSVIRLEIQGDFGFNGANRGIRWFNTDGVTADHLMRFAPDGVKIILASTQRFRVTSSGSVVLGTEAGALPTNAVNGFLYLWAMNGAPTGTPTAINGSVPIAVDTAASKLWANIGGAWKSVTLS